jgi:hypothetical protein
MGFPRGHAKSRSLGGFTTISKVLSRKGLAKGRRRRGTRRGADEACWRWEKKTLVDDGGQVHADVFVAAGAEGAALRDVTAGKYEPVSRFEDDGAAEDLAGDAKSSQHFQFVTTPLQMKFHNRNCRTGKPTRPPRFNHASTLKGTLKLDAERREKLRRRPAF